MIKFKKFVLGALVTSLICSNVVTAFADEVVAEKSYTTTVYYSGSEKIPDEYKERAKFKKELQEGMDQIDFEKVDPVSLTVGMGLYSSGLLFNFGIIQYMVVNNKDASIPDIEVLEGTVDGQGNIGEGVRLYAVNYNGTKTLKHVATVYNETAQTNLDAYNAVNGTSEQLEVVPGSKINYSLVQGTNNYIYKADVYFPEDFIYCDGIFAIDITKDLKKYGGNGQNAIDGFDFVDMNAYNVIKADTTNYKADTENKIKQLTGKDISVVADSYKLMEEFEIKELYKLATGKYPEGSTGNNTAKDVNKGSTTLDGKSDDQNAGTISTQSNGSSCNNTSNSTTPKTDNSPKTGDSTLLVLLFGGLIVSGAIVTGVVVSKKRRMY